MDYHLNYVNKTVLEASTKERAVVLQWAHFIQTGFWLDIKEVAYVPK